MDNNSSKIESTSNSDVESSCKYSPNEEGDLLMVRRLISQLCSIIIDSGKSVNNTSSRLVEKLKWPTLAHHKPYKLQWLNNKGELVVKK
ncbi:hypothetical protein CR513_33171, partial [Mucuna pruriens]